MFFRKSRPRGEFPTDKKLEEELSTTIKAEKRISESFANDYNRFLNIFATKFELYTGCSIHISGGYAWDFHNKRINPITAAKTTNDADFKILFNPNSDIHKSKYRQTLGNQGFLKSIIHVLNYTLLGDYYREMMMSHYWQGYEFYQQYKNYFHPPQWNFHEYLDEPTTEHPVSIDQTKPIKIAYNNNSGVREAFHILLEFTQISEKPALGIVEQRNEITDIRSLESFFNTSIRRRLADGDSNVYPIKLKSWKKQLDFLIDYMKKGIDLSDNPDNLFFTLDELALNLIKNLFKSNESGVNSNNNNSNNNNLPNLIRP